MAPRLRLKGAFHSNVSDFDDLRTISAKGLDELDGPESVCFSVWTKPDSNSGWLMISYGPVTPLIAII